MSSLTRILLFVGLSMSAAFPATASDNSERAAILAVVQKTFDALRTGDAEMWKDVLMKEGIMLFFRPDPEGESGALQMGVRRNDEHLKDITPRDTPIIERFTEEPTVLIRGPIAVVWGEYDLWVGDKFSHCGVDAIDLAKVDGTWKIANLTWTQEVENCPTADGPAPE